MILAVFLGNVLVAEKQVVKEDPVLDVGSLCHGKTARYVPLLKRFHKTGATIELNNPGAMVSTDLWIMKI